ncbi:MAG: hypothetical protein JXK95_13825 [Bacteroidales bacterium]|nr:hypothetical protein [Bacteroidales bacterium]
MNSLFWIVYPTEDADVVHIHTRMVCVFIEKYKWENIAPVRGRMRGADGAGTTYDPIRGRIVIYRCCAINIRSRWDRNIGMRMLPYTHVIPDSRQAGLFDVHIRQSHFFPVYRMETYNDAEAQRRIVI